MNKELLNHNIFEEEDSFDLKKELGYYLFFYPWFLISLIVFLTSTFVLLRYEDRIYQAEAQIKILKSDSDPSSFLTGGVEGLMNFDRVKLENDIAVMSSHFILKQVVERLNLQTKTYKFGSIVGSINSNLLFKELLPINVEFKYPENSKVLTFQVINNTLTINDGELSYILKEGQILDNETLLIRPENSLFLEDKEFQIVHTSLNNAVNELRANLVVEAASKRGEIVNLIYKGSNIYRNEAILNTLIDVLAEDQVSDKQEISKVSISFIEERLKSLTESIDTISINTIDFQRKNNIFDPITQTNSALNTIISGQQEIFLLGIQIEVAKELRKQLLAQNNYELIPANIGIDNSSVDQLVNAYNDIVIKRNTLMASATDQSPMVKQLDNQLQKSKSSIITGVNRYIEGLELSLNNYQQMESETRKKVAAFPGKENMLRTLTRNFNIEEELYIFLLKRKEEASISYIAALPNLKILSNGISIISPIYPKVKLFYLGAILFGIIFPFGILFLLKFLDTKINTREDLEKGLSGISILGEVPFDENLKDGENAVRGVTAESTRVLRSTMSFLLEKEKGNVIIVTSTTKGEGKSFVSYNLAASYKALGKKVILVGADLRNPQIHKRLGIERGYKGLSSFLADKNFNDLDGLIIKGSNPKEMDILLSGAIPPNPSELLMRPRMKELLERLKEKYDFILIDSAPLLLVSDTMALLPLSNFVVYVSRAQYSDKNIFPFINELQNRTNMPPFGMVLNGLISGPQSGYNYKYGYRYSYRYRYSYSYKYNYGYGYGYGADKDS